MHGGPSKTFFAPFPDSISDLYHLIIDGYMIINTPFIQQLSLERDFSELLESLDEKMLWMLTVAITVTIGTKLCNCCRLPSPWH